jgi:hypothetical protein
MPSKARIAFSENADDIERLIELHRDTGGMAKGRRFGLEVLNKSAIVLLTSFWEAYCEDIAAEALEHIVVHAPSADKLPEELRKLIAKELKQDSHELAIWKLADGCWREVLRNRLVSMQAERNRRLNTPKSGNIDQLFCSALGIPRISDKWRWKRIYPDNARHKLDYYVELRGAIAHRGSAASSVTKFHVTNYFFLLKRLVGRTGGTVRAHVRDITSTLLWNDDETE